MRKALLTLVVGALALVAARAQATPATCTVTKLDVAGTFPFFNIGGLGLVIPVDIDAASGQFTFQRDAFTTPHPSPGLEFPTGFGPNGWLDWDPGPITGTIDSNGQIVLPHFGMRFWTDFGTPGPSLAGNIDANFTTAMQAQGVAGRFFLFNGVPVDAQGSVRLVGTDFINYQLPLQTGTGLTCTLAPAPALATLPKGAGLASARGVTKKGPDAEEADDSLTLTAVLVPGATPPVLDGSQDVLLRLQPATGKPVNILVPSGHAGGTAKKLSVKDADGSVIQAISDAPSSQDTPAAPPPTQGGSLIVKKGKKRMTFTFKVKGIETMQLTGPVAVTLGVGNLDASRQVTFTATKKGSKFH